MSNLRPERRADKNGHVVTRHVRDRSATAEAGAAKLGGLEPPSPAGAPAPSKREHFTEFDFSAAPREGYEPPSYTRTSSGGRTEEVGSKFGPGSPRRAADIAKALREDIKEAVEAGWLPDGLKFAVTTQKAAMTQSVHLAATGLPDEMIHGGTNEYGKPLLTDFAAELSERMHQLVESYNSGYSDWQSDASYQLYYCGTEIKDSAVLQWEAEEAARKRQAREERIERQLGR